MAKDFQEDFYNIKTIRLEASTHIDAGSSSAIQNFNHLKILIKTPQ